MLFPLAILSTTIILLTIVIQAALSAPVLTSPSFTPALTLYLPTKLNGTTSNGNCASSYKFPTWNAPDWDLEDCYSAVHQLYIQECLTHPDEAFEFVAGAAGATRPTLTRQASPRKYVVRSCVLTVMMLEWFPFGTLPDFKVPSYHWPKTDVSTYRQIYAAAKGIETQCTETNTPGWAMAGEENAMGVFVWATHSYINEATGGIPVFPPPLGADASAVASS